MDHIFYIQRKWGTQTHNLYLKGSTGEVHCEKVTCPVLTCSHPVRRNPSDCCKECPEEERTPAGLEHSDMMQADGPRHCKFGKNYYQNSDNWHPWVPLVGEMKCINCWCDVSIVGAKRYDPSVNTVTGMLLKYKFIFVCEHSLKAARLNLIYSTKFIF